MPSRHQAGFIAALLFCLSTVIASAQNVVDLGEVSGAFGTSVSVPILLDSSEAAKGLQVDLVYDPTVVVYTGIETSGRGNGMMVDGEIVEPGRVRVLLFYGSASTISTGTGAIGACTFLLIGEVGTLTTISPTDAILAGPDAESLTVTTEDGSLTIAMVEEAPTVQISTLRNPGRSRSLQIIVRVANGDGTVPTVTAGGETVTMAAVATAVFMGHHHGAESATSVTIDASATNASGTGDDEVTVAYAKGGAR